MGFAPLLDASAFRGSHAWHIRRAALAAASVLRSLAADGGTALRAALEQVAQVRETPEELDNFRIDARLSQHLRSLEAFGKVHESSALDESELMAHLIAQLRQVKEFGELDKATLDEYIGPVSKFIREGNIELFAGYVSRLLKKPDSSTAHRRSVSRHRVNERQYP